MRREREEEEARLIAPLVLSPSFRHQVRFHVYYGTWNAQGFRGARFYFLGLGLCLPHAGRRVSTLSLLFIKERLLATTVTDS